MPDKYSLLAHVSRENLRRDVTFLSTQWPTRHTLSQHHESVASAVAQALKERGYTPTFHHYTQQGRPLRNVLAEKAGPKTSPLLLCAHFDSRQQRLHDPEAPAPGADDNATGVAVLWEVARLIRPLRFKNPIRFAFFSGEEQGLWGSRAYATALAAQKAPLELVFNLDQVGYPGRDRALFLDRDQGGVRQNNAASAKHITRLETLAQTVVKVPTKIDPVEGSDYVPFEQQGYTVVGLYEGEYRYPHYHKNTDTPDKVDYAYLHEMARLTLAFVLDYAV